MPQRNRYTPETLSEVVRTNRSWAAVARHYGVRGGSVTYLRKLAEQWEIDFSHFTGLGQGWSKGIKREDLPQRKAADEILVLSAGLRPAKPHMLRRALQEVGIPHACAECGMGPEWNGKPLVLHVDHRNGNRFDNRRENLRFLCPNCHSQTENFGAGNSSVRGVKRKLCLDCGKRISDRALRCRECARAAKAA